MKDQVVELNNAAMEQALSSAPKGSINHYQQLIDSSPDVICSIDRNGRFVTVSAASKDLWGYTPEELKGMPYIDLVIDKDKAHTRKAAIDIMAGITMTNFENRYLCKNGTIRPILWSARWNEEAGLMYCVAKDATQLKLAERRLYRAYKLSEIAWWEYDVATQTYTASDEVFEIYGLPIPEDKQISLTKFLSLVHPEDEQRVRYDLLHLFEDSYFTYEHKLIKPTGEIIYMIHFSELERDKNGNPVKLHGTSKDITRRKVNQIKLEASERALQQYASRLSDILESFGDGFFALDRSWNITYWNKKAEELLYRKRETLLGKNIWDELEDAKHQKFYREYQRALQENTPVHFEEYYAGAQSWLEVSAYPSKEGLSVYFKNINERKRQEKELKISNERFGFVSQATSDVVWDWNLETGELYINQSFTKIFGHELDYSKPLSKLWLNNLHPEDKERVILSQTNVLSDKKASFWENSYRFKRSNKEVAYVIDRAIIVRDQEGKALRMIGAVQDITEQKKQEQRLAFFAKATSEVIYEREWNSKEVALNHVRFNQLFGYNLSSNRIQHSTWYKKLHPEDVPRMREVREQALNSGSECYENEYRFRKADGTWAYVKDRTYIIKNDEGTPLSILGAMEDITNERLSEIVLKEREHSYRQLFNCSPIPTMVFNQDTFRIIDVNSKAIEAYGYSKEEFQNLTLLDLRPDDEKQKLQHKISKLKPTGINHFQGIVHQKKGGELILTEIYSTIIDYQGHKAVLAMVKDISEQVRLQEELVREKVNQQKSITKAAIEAQEQERSEIGKELHDNICQLLATAKLYLKSINSYPEQTSHFLDKGAQLLQSSMDEIRKLSKSLVTPTFDDVPFTFTLTELANSYSELKLFRVDYHFNFDENKVEKGLRLTIYRIIQEQFNNAIKYAQARQVSIRIQCISNTLQLSYTDDGIGFDISTVKKGLGLHNIKNRADAYKGSFQLNSSPGHGCQMNICFNIGKQQTLLHQTTSKQTTK